MGNGEFYRGYWSITKAGPMCQRWDMTTPHTLFVTPESLGVTHLADANNYCRNVGLIFPEPWCLSVDPNLRTARCGIPECGEIFKVTMESKFVVPNCTENNQMMSGECISCVFVINSE